MRETVSQAELHRRFLDALKEAGRSDSVFVFEIDRKSPGADGCNWYPLASIALWRGDVLANLAAFRQVRERLSTLYNLEPADAEAPAAAAVGAWSSIVR